MAALMHTFCLLAFIWFQSAYSFSYVLDSWGSITLPFRTNRCQHTLTEARRKSISTWYTYYECATGAANGQTMTKKVYENNVCTEKNHTDSHTFTANDTATYDCGDDLRAVTEEDVTVNDEQYVMAIHAICDLEPPSERDLYLAPTQLLDEGSCFLLSNKTVTTGNSTAVMELYATLDCLSENFTTKLYVNDPACSDSAEKIITRTIPLLECKEWLFENETEFGFNLTATMWSCDYSRACTWNRSLIPYALLMLISLIRFV
mmetsp:Transcript_21262/g.34000  ORF Transcript_21262/g.34000 Transcript_21262/m.34000 type:complete len:261 (-) Transcript_21262:641-1423(-)